MSFREWFRGSRRTCSVGIAMSVLCTATCGENPAPEQQVVVDREGVEVVTVTRLPGLDDPDYQWGSRIDLEIPTQLGVSGAPLVFSPEGIVPLSSDTLLVYDASGEEALAIISISAQSLVRRFAPRGEGPGEVRGMRAVWLSEDGSIRLFDPISSQVFSYSRDGALQDATPAPVSSQNAPWVRDMSIEPILQQRMPDGDLALVRLTEVAGAYEGRFLHALPAPVGTGLGGTRTLWVSLPEGIVWTSTDSGSYHVLNEAGVLIRRIELPLSQRSIAPAEATGLNQGAAASLGLVVPAGPIGLTNIMFSFGDSIFGLYQSNLWRAAEDPELSPDDRVWRLISVSGRYMGTFNRSEAGFEPLWIRGLTAWGVASDSLGIPIIQKRTLLPPDALKRAGS